MDHLNINKLERDALDLLGWYIAKGARLQWGNDGAPIDDDKFYLFARDGNGIAEGGSVLALAMNIAKGK